MPRVSAQQVYSLYSKDQLTEEQVGIVEQASISSPSLVIAGAGSGKTELMMVRAMFLVANEYATPDQILGLTFTRKAANELRTRIAQGLIRLRESDFWQKSLGDDFSPAKIATYNSFGNEIFRAHALEIGFESDSVLLTDALAVALVKELIEQSGNRGLEEYEGSLNSLAEKVLRASAQLIDHQVDSTKVSNFFSEFIETISSLPKTDAGEAGLYSYTEEYLLKAKNARLVFELAAEFQEFKRSRNLFDYADQVALTLRVKEFDPDVIPYRFVMLDEYQDTSEIQSQLLSRLFHSKPVMAVGDPNQSIYAWRGASTSNLTDFFEDFGEGESFTLSTSWRSGEKILAAANQLARKVDNGKLAPLTLSAGKQIESKVYIESFEDGEAEAEAVTSWIAKRIDASKTAAILFRNKDAMRSYAQRLDELAIPHEITGLSGLLEQPEVIDLISILRLVANPESSVDFLRIITGPKYRLAASDIAALTGIKRRVSALRKLPRHRSLTFLELIDQLELPSVAKLVELSEVSLHRLIDFGNQMRRLRSLASLSLTEIAWRVVEEFEIDIELYAHSPLANPLANLRSFISRISEFETNAERATLAELVSWLDYALQSESFELPRGSAKKGVVQLMSVHAAKGLEWDVVAIPTMSEGSFPSEARDLKNWLAGGILPGEFRLDRKNIPILSFLGISNQRQFNQRVEAYGEELKIHNRIQERRLAYVALTRAAKELMLSASYFYEKWSKSVEHSEFLLELTGFADVVNLAEKPNTRPVKIAKNLHWPKDPLGESRSNWLSAAQSVSDSEPAKLSDDVLLLLKEKNLREKSQPPKLPLRLSASSIVKLLLDPESFSKSLARPLPSPYSKAADIGTNFHAELEKTFQAGSELDFSVWSEEEQKLGVNFAKSRFASLEPVMVEKGIEFAVGGSVVVCKLDAVYEISGEYQVVDWKSGSKPTGEELRARAIQLALYRIALSKLLNLPPERIRASFFYAATGEEYEPELPGELEIAKRLEEFRKARPNR